MPYNKIKLNQIEKPSVSSEDLSISSFESGYEIELKNSINQDLRISGSLNINGNYLLPDGDEVYGDQNQIFIGAENYISGEKNTIIRGDNNSILGANNIVLNGDNNNFYLSNSCGVLAGSNIFLEQANNSVVIASNDESKKTFNKNNSCLIQHDNIYVYGGLYFQRDAFFYGSFDSSDINCLELLKSNEITVDFEPVFNNNFDVSGNFEIFNGAYFGQYLGANLERKNYSNNVVGNIYISGDEVATKEWVDQQGFIVGTGTQSIESVEISGNLVLEPESVFEIKQDLIVTGDVYFSGTSGADAYILSFGDIECNDLEFISGAIYDVDDDSYNLIATKDWVTGQEYIVELGSGDYSLSSGFDSENSVYILDQFNATGDIFVNSGITIDGNINSKGGVVVSGQLDSTTSNIYVSGLSVSGGFESPELINDSLYLDISGGLISGDSIILNSFDFSLTGSNVVTENYIEDNYLLEGDETELTFKNANFQGDSAVDNKIKIENQVSIEDFNLNGSIDVDSKAYIENINGDIHVNKLNGDLNFSLDQCNFESIKGTTKIEFLEESLISGVNTYDKQNDIIDITISGNSKSDISKVWANAFFTPYSQTFTDNDTGEFWWKSMTQGLTGYEDFGFELRIKEVSSGVYVYDEGCLEGWMEWLAINEPIKGQNVTGYMSTQSQVNCFLENEIQNITGVGVPFEESVLNTGSLIDIVNEADRLVSGLDLRLKDNSLVEYRVFADESMPALFSEEQSWGTQSYYPRFRIKN